MNAARTKTSIEPPDDDAARDQAQIEPTADEIARIAVADPPIEPLDDPPETDIDRDLRFCLDYMAEMQVEADAKDCELTSAQSLIRELQRDIFRRTAEAARDAPVLEWLALRRAARAVDWPYQNCLKMCNLRIIVAEKRGGRWYAEMGSLRAQVAAQRSPVPAPKRRLIIP